MEEMIFEFLAASSFSLLQLVKGDYKNPSLFLFKFMRLIKVPLKLFQWICVRIYHHQPVFQPISLSFMI